MRLPDRLVLGSMFAGVLGCSAATPAAGRVERELIITQWTEISCPSTNVPMSQADRSTGPSVGRRVGRMDITVAPTFIGTWSEPLDVEAVSTLGAARDAQWFYNYKTKRLLLRDQGGNGPMKPVATLTTPMATVHDDGSISAFGRRPDRRGPMSTLVVDSLNTFNNEGRRTLAMKLDWGNTELSSVASAIRGGFVIAAVTVAGKATIGRFEIEAPHNGRVDVIVGISQDGDVLYAVPLEDTLPGTIVRIEADDHGVWVLSTLRERSRGLGLIRIQGGNHEFTRAIRPRNGGDANAYSFAGPLVFGEGIAFVGSLDSFDWGDGALSTEDPTMIVQLDDSGNLQYAKTLASGFVGARIVDGQLLVLTSSTSGEGVAVVGVDPDGSAAFSATLPKPSVCDTDSFHSYGRFPDQLVMHCYPYYEGALAHKNTLLYSATLTTP